MNKNKPRVVVVDRDRQILIALFKNKALSLEQIHNRFFNGRSRTVVCTRLSKLFHLGLLEKKPFYDQKRIRIAYGLSKKGLEEIKSELPYEVNHRYYVSDSLQHDIILADVSEIFKKFKITKEVITESELQSVSEFLDRHRHRAFVGARSDRMILMEKRSRIYVALEYERVLKSSQRIKNKYDYYYRSRTIDVVLYVCEDPSLMKSMMKINEEKCKNSKSKIFFCTREHLESFETEAHFVCHEEIKIRLEACDM